MPLITFTDKVDSRIVNVPAVNKIVASDVNDLKDGVNANEVDIETNTSTILTLQVKPSEGAFVDGDKTKLDGIETSADVTDVTNVTAAGALMDSEVVNLAQVKSFDTTDYAQALGVNDNYVTDAEKTVIGNTSNTNTGDQDLSVYQLLSQKDANSGYVGLDSGGKINPLQLPAVAITETFVVNSQTAMLAIVGQTGDVAVRTDVSKSFILTADDPTVLANWQNLITPTSPVDSVFGRTGVVTAQNGDYTKAQIGLSNVPNTDFTSAVNLNTAKVSFDSTSSTRLVNTSGTNTGDQTLTSLGAAPAENSINYIRNSSSSQAANFHINGNGEMNNLISEDGSFSGNVAIGGTATSTFVFRVRGNSSNVFTINGATEAAVFSSSVSATDGLFSGNVTLSNANTPILKLIDTTNNVSLLFGADNANTFLRSSSGSIFFQTNGGISALTLAQDQSAAFASSVSATDGIFSGNVGIGTNTPSTLLDLYNTGTALPSTSGTSQSAGHKMRLGRTDGAVLDIGSNGGSGLWLQSTNGSNLSLTYPLLINPNGGSTLFGTTTDNGSKLQVNGSATFASTVTATNFILSSDKRLKENIKKVDNKHINANWKTFEMKSEKGQKRYGVIAQELEVKNPEFVRTDKEGMKSVAYIDLLIAKIAELEARLEKLEK